MATPNDKAERARRAGRMEAALITLRHSVQLVSRAGGLNLDQVQLLVEAEYIAGYDDPQPLVPNPARREA